MTDFKVGDRVKFKDNSMMGAGQKRRGKVGVIIAVHNPPAQGGLVADVSFGANDVESGIRLHELELG